MPATEKPEIHLPSPSFWPILVALGVLLIALGIIFNLIISLVGVVLLLGAQVGWMLENRVDAADQEAAHE
jgi:cytochrome c oxidase subunit 1